jgi:ethanolamine ammonia-lyase small subunit
VSDGPGQHRDPWHALSDHTAARIALGRTGASLPTARLLEFSLAHAMARDAVLTPLDREALKRDLEAQSIETLLLESAAGDRQTYLTRPDLGRRLSHRSRERLDQIEASADIAVVVADGLSSRGVAENASDFCAALLPGLQARKLSIGPVTIIENGRVAIADEIGAALGARLAIMLIGERPGLSSPDSLGCYLTFAPRIGRADSQRNCISNIRGDGLKPPLAVARALWLIDAALARGLTGVGLKDESDLALPGGTDAAIEKG